MIKVVYKALIETTIVVDEHNDTKVLPFKQVKENFQNQLTSGIRNILKDEVFSEDYVKDFTVTEQRLDIWREK